MRVYITCELDKTPGIGYIESIDPYDNIESAINRAKVLIKDEMYHCDIEQRNEYLNKFEADANKYLRNGLTYEDQRGIVRIIVKDM